MSVSQVTLVTFSPTGSTAKILKEIASGMSYPVKHLDLTLPSARQQKKQFGPNELVIVGMPVYGGRLPLPADEILDCIKGNGTPAVLVTVYGNRDFDDALLEMKNMMAERGFKHVAASACIAQHTLATKVAHGRPDQSDKTAMKDFGARVEAKLKAGNQTLVDVPGVFPYRKEARLNPPFAPENSSDCTRCGACADVCAFGAISPSDPSKTDVSRCVICQACVQVCPVSARAMKDERFFGVIKFVEENALANRKDPAFFV